MRRRPRYLPDRDFPAYTFVPGHTPHPISDPAGHSYGQHHRAGDALTEANWADNEDYLWGVDLYNHGYPWEAHESWEGIWRIAERRSIIHMHLQGLIQCAAAVVKAKGDQRAGVDSLSKSGTEQLAAVARAAGSPFLGIDLDRFVKAFRSYARARTFKPENWPIIELKLEPGG